MLFATQSAINMAVNLRLIPAKGMTLPFISYGGSSMIAVGFEIGLLLAFTRRRAEASRLAPRLGFPAAPSPGTSAGVA
jgi:cell division protein FtsW